MHTQIEHTKTEDQSKWFECSKDTNRRMMHRYELLSAFESLFVVGTTSFLKLRQN